MKKSIVFSLFILLIYSQNSFCQLKVTSSGHIGIATDVANSVLSVGGNGSGIFTAQFSPVEGRKSVSIYNVSYTTEFPLGLYIDNAIYNTDKTIWGMRVHSTAINGLTSGTYYGIVSNGGGSYNRNIGIMGGLEGSSLLGTSNAGIYGSASTSDDFQYSGTYAGYFNGNVRTTGATYSNLLSPSPVSSSTTAISLDESERGNGTVEKLSQVTPVVVIGEKEAKATLSDDYVKMAESLGENVPNDIQHVQTQMSSVRYSIDAESLREAYPELVYEDNDGNVCINYIEMVPLLVQSIKELSAKVTTLEEQLGIKDSSKKAKQQTTGIDDSDIEVVSMSQNRPNPFKDKSVIALNVPSDTKQAVINIYDMSGKQVQTIPVSERGKTNITVYARHLQPGMFIYSLLVDGKVQATRKMMVVE